MFFSLNSSHYMSNNFLLNKISLKLSNSVAILSPSAELCSLPPIFFIEYIFDFDPTNSVIITNKFSYNNSTKFIFHFRNNFLISLVKKL